MSDQAEIPTQTTSATSEWYALPRPQELPLAMTVEAAGRLCGIGPPLAYYLARHGDWRGFTRSYGTRGGLLVRTRELLAWLEAAGDVAGDVK